MIVPKFGAGIHFQECSRHIDFQESARHIDFGELSKIKTLLNIDQYYVIGISSTQYNESVVCIPTACLQET